MPVLTHVAEGDPHVKAHNDERDALDTVQAFAVQRGNHVGTESADVLTDGTTNKAFLATERTKLSGIAAGATVNSPDATLLNRANHTGTQVAATISDLATVATSGAYADLSGTPGTPLAVVQYSGSLTTARPSASVVMWEGFPSQPTNMANGDFWSGPPDSSASSVFDRSAAMGPAGTVRANFDRSNCSMGQTVALTMGTLSMTLIYMFAGDTFSNINVRAGTGGWTGITNSWAVFADINLNPLAVSSNITTATQAAQTTRAFPIVGAPYVALTTGLYYVGVMAAGTTAPVVGPNAMSIGQQNIAPLSGGTSNTGQTTPPTVGGSALTALTVVANPIPYLWLT
jgi:hypothetical protein